MDEQEVAAKAKAIVAAIQARIGERWPTDAIVRAEHAAVETLMHPEVGGVRIDLPALRDALTALREHRDLIDEACLETRGNKLLQPVCEALALIVEDDWRPQDGKRPR